MSAAPVKAPTAAASSTTAFTLLVSRLGDKPAVYVFDQPTVAIGRGRECDLRVEHDGFSRRQVIVQRTVNSTGAPRFRLIPQKTSNPTFINGQPLVEGAIKTGDVVAVADIRITFVQGKAEDALTWARGGGGSGARSSSSAASPSSPAFCRRWWRRASRARPIRASRSPSRSCSAISARSSVRRRVSA